MHPPKVCTNMCLSLCVGVCMRACVCVWLYLCSCVCIMYVIGLSTPQTVEYYNNKKGWKSPTEERTELPFFKKAIYWNTQGALIGSEVKTFLCMFHGHGGVCLTFSKTI